MATSTRRGVMGIQKEVSQALGDLIHRHSDKLTPADTRLLDVLMQDPVRAAMENGTAVSSRAGVHPASAVRLARRLGFAGYPEFRSFIQANLIEGGGDFEYPAARMAARLVRADGNGLMASLLDSEISALQQVRNIVHDADIRAFSESLRDSRRVLVLGRGACGVLIGADRPSAEPVRICGRRSRQPYAPDGRGAGGSFQRRRGLAAGLS